MRVIVFGGGSFYRQRKEKLKKFTDIEIVAFADNNMNLWNQIIDDIIVISPNSIKTQLYDFILIMSNDLCQIYSQLIELGVDSNRIWEWERLCAKYRQGHINMFCPNKKVLVISQSLNYDGGSLASIYAAIALKNIGMSVVLSVPGGNSKLITETVDQGIPVLTDLTLPYVFESDQRWISQFDVVLVNLLTMVESAYSINQFCPVLWWIHEQELVYEALTKKSICLMNKKFEDISIYAVSNIARKNFIKYVSPITKKKLIPGIPDRFTIMNSEKKGDKLVFAIVGTIHRCKAQDIFLKAALDMREMAEFWIIGKLLDDDYCNNIRIKVEEAGSDSIKLLGEMTRAELEAVFADIDVVVCASLEETLSMTIVEAMMYEKICITTDNTGIAEYIHDGVNGFVVPVNDTDTLKMKMNWIIANRKEAEKIRKAARKTYEENFTMEVFGKNLELALDETVYAWQANRNT